jgi:hypothetical protein
LGRPLARWTTRRTTPTKFSSAESRLLVTTAEPASKTAPHGEALTSDTPGTLDRCACRDGKDHSIRKYVHRNPLIPFKPYFFIKAETTRFLRRHYSDPRRASGEIRSSITARSRLTIRSRKSFGVGEATRRSTPVDANRNSFIQAHPSSGVLHVIGASVVPCGQVVLVVDAPIRRHKFARRMDYFQQMLPLRKKTARL